MTVLAERPTAVVPRINSGMPVDIKTIDLSGYEEFAGRMRFTRDVCNALEREGHLNDRYELLDGEIIVKMCHNRLHAVVMVLLMKWINATFDADYIQCQLPVDVADEDRAGNRPEPDVSVLARSALEFLTTAPGPGDIRLVVEVSDTSLVSDIRVKSNLYARASFPDYWVLDALGRRIYVHRDPDKGKYETITVFDSEQTLSPLSAQDKVVRVADLLPPAESSD